MNTKTMDAREAAFKTLEAYRRSKAWPDLTLGALIDIYSITERDAALATHIASGVMQNMALLDYYVASFSSLPLKKIQPNVLDVLRLSVYQIVFLTKVPHRASVDQGVALAKRHSNPRAAGFVNADLRKAAHAAEDGLLPEVTADSELMRLSIQYSHPEWLVEMLCERLGCDGAEALLAANNAQDTPVFANVNTLQANVGDVLYSLEIDGVQADRHEWLDDCIELRGSGKLRRLRSLIDGDIYIQDPASRLAVIAAGVKPGDFVIDGCSAPGGKAFAAAISMRDRGRIAACDVSAKKLHLVEDGAARLGLGIIEAVERDASESFEGFAGRADVVLADVPCSGFGIIRKKPEIRYKSEHDVSVFPEAQKRILSTLAQYVKPGGSLLYSTCTVLRRENEDVVDSFLGENAMFSREAFTLPGIGEVPDGMITLWPHIHGTDGFFICRFRRGM